MTKQNRIRIRLGVRWLKIIDKMLAKSKLSKKDVSVMDKKVKKNIGEKYFELKQ